IACAFPNELPCPHSIFFSFPPNCSVGVFVSLRKISPFAVKPPYRKNRFGRRDARSFLSTGVWRSNMRRRRSLWSRWLDLRSWCLAVLPCLPLGCTPRALTPTPPIEVTRAAAAEEPAVLPKPREENKKLLPINLDTVLRLAQDQNGQVAIAREKV